jgi:hypothetical protein
VLCAENPKLKELKEEKRGQYFFHAADHDAYDLPLLQYDAWNRLVRVRKRRQNNLFLCGRPGQATTR